MIKFKQIKIAIIGFISITLLSFAIQQLTQEEELIVGTWLSDGNSDMKWVFTQDKKNKKINTGQVYKTYYYSIVEEKSTNGKLTLSFLKLVNINNSEEVFEYEINGLGNNEMALDYLGDLGTKLLFFTKE